MPVTDVEHSRLLSGREQQVAALVCNALSNKTIANRLGLTAGTVKQHVHNVLVKLNVNSRGQLMLLMGQREKSDIAALSGDGAGDGLRRGTGVNDKME